MILTPDRLVEEGGRTLEDGGTSCATEPMPIVQEEVKQEEEAKDEEEIKQGEEVRKEEEEER